MFARFTQFYFFQTYVQDDPYIQIVTEGWNGIGKHNLGIFTMVDSPYTYIMIQEELDFSFLIMTYFYPKGRRHPLQGRFENGHWVGSVEPATIYTSK